MLSFYTVPSELLLLLQYKLLFILFLLIYVTEIQLISKIQLKSY